MSKILTEMMAKFKGCDYMHSDHPDGAYGRYKFHFGQFLILLPDCMTKKSLISL